MKATINTTFVDVGLSDKLLLPDPKYMDKYNFVSILFMGDSYHCLVDVREDGNKYWHIKVFKGVPGL